MAKMEVDERTISEIHTIYNILLELDSIIKSDRKRGIELYELAKENYEAIKAKTELDDMPSDDGAIEEQINSALEKMTMAYKELVNSSDKLPKMMDIIGKLQVAKYKGEIFLKIAGQGEKTIDIENADDKLKLIREKRNLLKQVDNMDKEDY